MPFVGTFDIETGDPIKLLRFYNSTFVINGFISYEIDETLNGDFLGNVKFSNYSYSFFRLSYNNEDFLWKTYLNIETIMTYNSRQCHFPGGSFMYAGLAIA